MRKSTFAIAALALSLAGLHRAQAAEAGIEGTIRDSLGRPIAGVALVLEGADGKPVAHATGDSSGHFVFPPVAPGPYAVLATKDGYEEGTVLVTAGAAQAADLVLQAKTALDMAVTAKKLDQARNALSPQTGTSAYTIDAKAIDDLPQGADTSFNQVLEQAPGVARDSYGQVHVRGEHANLQYRINGVLLPEGIDAFGQVIDARIADRVQFLTGALPAQYGYRTAGVVDIQTKSGAFEQGGVSDLTVGSDGSWHPSLTYAGHSGNMNYFLSGDYLSSDYGVETPTAAYHPIHDATTQGKGFGYVSYLLNPTNRLNVIFGTSTNNYQIPNNPDQPPSYTVAGAGIVNSRDLKETQFEQSHYGTIALQGTDGDWGYQIAPYIRYSQTHYHPDTVGDLEYTGVATDVLRSDLALGLQGDGSWRANDHHTLRAGVMAQHETASTADNAQTFLADDDGNQISDTPITINDDHHKEGVLAGVYLQDEWTITDWLTMNYGARFDQVNAYVDENQLSPRLGFVIKATPTTTLHAGYARYFTPPPLELIDNSTISAFSGTTAQTETSTNDAVRAERSHSFDVGITQKLGEHMQMGVDSYYKLVRNMLDEGQFGSALIYTPFNYAKGRIYGVETTFSYTADSWDGYVNLAASRAMGKDIISGQENFSQDELDYISGHWVHLDHDQTFTASIGGTYRPREGTKLSADAILGSGLREGFANTGHLPGYGTINLGATQHVGIDARGFDVHLSLINLFDKDYELRDGSGIGVGAPQWGQRRTFYLGITRTF